LEAKEIEKKTTNTNGPSSFTQENWTFVLCYCYLGRSFETREERTHPIDKNACKPHHEIEMFLEDDERSTRIVNWVF
jgi:hypothetical protein